VKEGLLVSAAERGGAAADRSRRTRATLSARNAHSAEFEGAAAQVLLDLSLHEPRHASGCLGVLAEGWPVGLDELVEKRFLGTMHHRHLAGRASKLMAAGARGERLQPKGRRCYGGLVMTKQVAVLVALVIAGCGGSEQKQANDPSAGFMQPTVPPANAGPKEGAWSSEPSNEGPRLNEDQKKQMEVALHRGGEKAANCGETSGGEPGKGEVTVTFDGQKGRVTDVAVGQPWAGKDAETCIKRAFEGEIVMPFDGDPIDVPYTVEIVDKKKTGANETADKKKAGAKPGSKPGEKSPEKPADKPKK